MGLAREVFELDGSQVVGAAPTGIATVGLADEGFTNTATVDRLLLDLQRGRIELDGRTVLVVDEAAMVGTRKLAPLLGHAERAGAKVVLVGDDRQFASIAAGAASRPAPPAGRQRADREPAAGGGLGAAGHRRCAGWQPGAGDRRLCRP